ncbi:Hexosyltransferase [Rhynchospora pubera]|uniref:Hexosyltransferase n=1 Tax=Rhynchospora pubera TaxID=906938 RepID=A0AAV8FSV3_9POAL|nr:Hexosyltransferase [Rhynchospora pubera]
MKPSNSDSTTKSHVVRNIHIAFLLLVLVATITLYIQPVYLFQNNSGTKDLRKAENRIVNGKTKVGKIAIEKAPGFLAGLDEKTRIGLVNLPYDDAKSCGINGSLTVVDFDVVSNDITWNDLYPSWIDEEGESGSHPTCPTIPMPDFSAFNDIDLVVAQLPCWRPEAGWNRDVFRLQVHLVAANLAVKKGKRNKINGAVKLVFTSRCEPMRDLFRCDDLVKKDGTWWMYEVDVMRLEDKVRSPPGTCELISPLLDEGPNKGFDAGKFKPLPSHRRQREAYVTVLHSSDTYVCGAITLAHSIRKVGSTRDLVLLHDEFINPTQLRFLGNAGWSLRQIERIHNPHPRSDRLYEYSYSKFHIFQLTEYDKIVFLDADIMVLRNLDMLFNFPSISARGDHDELFNAGIMVVEPSNCTFKTFMLNINSVKSYDGGDQGFLNEMFVWWHRLPRRTNFFKMIWANTTKEKLKFDSMFVADPPQLYAIHYFGLKPWMCYRDYDCNWDLETVRGFANDEAHWRWWRVYDGMDEGLKKMCRLSIKQKRNLNHFRLQASKMRYSDGHWKWNITDPRKDI